MRTVHSLAKYGPDQLSYWVEDVDAAAEHFAKVFGAGPFLKMGPLKFEKAIVHGKPADPELIIALGMWGQIQVEFVQKVNAEAHLFDDFGYGFNHINICVDDVEGTVRQLEKDGYEVGMYMESSGAPIYYMNSMNKIGHCIELHAPNPTIAMCKKAVELWDGKDPLMDMAEVIAAMRAGA